MTGDTDNVSLRSLAVYAVPFMGGASLLFTVQFFFLKYATDVLLLSPMVIGLVFGLSRLVDAVTDPLVGTWSDRTTSRMGRRAPWMLLATPLIAISFFLIWNPPAMKELATTVWVGGWLVVFYVCFTGYNVPHFALGAEISESPHSKTRLYGSRQIVETIGMLLAFVVIQTISDDTDPRTHHGRDGTPLHCLPGTHAGYTFVASRTARLSPQRGHAIAHIDSRRV